MKVIALVRVNYNGVNYNAGEEFEHHAPEEAIKLNLLKSGEESEGDWVEGSDKPTSRKAKKD